MLRLLLGGRRQAGGVVLRGLQRVGAQRQQQRALAVVAAAVRWNSPTAAAAAEKEKEETSNASTVTAAVASPAAAAAPAASAPAAGSSSAAATKTASASSTAGRKKRRRKRRAGGSDAALQEDIDNFARKRQTGVSLSNLMETGKGELLHVSPVRNTEDCSVSEQVLMQVATFLHRELPIRLAQRVVDLQNMPLLSEMPSIREVCEWYRRSFSELRALPQPTSIAEDRRFAKTVQLIYDRHAPTLMTMARGAWELRDSLRRQGSALSFEDNEEIQAGLDRFYSTRIGIRILISQYLELRKSQPEDVIGLVHQHTSPSEVAQDAIMDAREVCLREYIDAPEVTLHGRLDLTFPYIPSHLHHILFELLKNSMRATIEFHGEDAKLPRIRIIIADGEDNEDIVIKVSDEGGGIKRSNMPKIWSYLFTTASPSTQESMIQSEQSEDFSRSSPLAGLGYGLPISRAHARYFGGDLQVVSMEGYGSDAFVYLSRLGDQTEQLPCLSERGWVQN